MKLVYCLFQEIREFVFDEFFAGKKAVTRVLKQTPTAEKVAKESGKLETPYSFV